MNVIKQISNRQDVHLPFLPVSEKTVIWILAVICVVFIWNVYQYNYISDDAFILLRYTKNFIQGEGLVFNPNERVEGFTSLLWVLLLSIFGKLHIDLLLSARFLGILAGLITIILTYSLSVSLNETQRSSPSVIVFLPPLMLALNGAFACWAGSGMETIFFVCLIAGSCWALLNRKVILSGILISTSVLTRPEGIVMFGLFLFFLLIQARQNKIEDNVKKRWTSCLLGCVVVIVALFLFRRFYFGEWLPNTFYAKIGGGWDQIARGLKYFSEYASDHEGLIVMLASAGFILFFGDFKARYLACGVIAFWGTTIWEGGDGLPMYRFALVPLPLLLILQGTLIHKFCVHGIGLSKSATSSMKYFLALITLLWAITHLSKPIVASHYILYEYQKSVEIPRWTLVGKWFKENASQDQSLATVPVGAVSYYSELKVYDIVGMTDKHIAHLTMPSMGKGWAGHEKHDGQYILSRKPTYLLLGNIDVTDKPRNTEDIPFVPYYNKNIWERERDFYDTDLIFKMYIPRSVKIAPQQYLNFYELKEEWR